MTVTSHPLSVLMSQQKKRYKGLMLNIFYIEKKNRQESYNLDSYGGLLSSVTCVTTSCINDSFASPTHRTNQSLDKGLWDVVPLINLILLFLFY
jgi:hypothetical protein